jgi:transcriptional regulator with XRE-family HTH domain
MLDLNFLGATIAEHRKKLGLTQAELAGMADTSRSTIALLETGQARELGFNKMARILSVLRLELKVGEANAGRPTLDDLLNRTGSSQASTNAEPSNEGRP